MPNLGLPNLGAPNLGGTETPPSDGVTLPPVQGLPPLGAPVVTP